MLSFKFTTKVTARGAKACALMSVTARGAQACARMSVAARGAQACALGLALMSVSGCLLLADPPPLSDLCVDEDLGERAVPTLAEAESGISESTYDCQGFAGSSADHVVAWTAPETGYYVFSAASLDLDLRIGVTEPTCGGDIVGCTENDAGITREVLQGEVVHVVVENDSFDEGDFTISIRQTDAPDAPDPNEPVCPYQGDGVCDEPEGTNRCPDASDPEDCPPPSCPWTNDGVCDEPEGTNICPEGSDPGDCS